MSAPADVRLRGSDESLARARSDVLPYLVALTGLAVLLDAWPLQAPLAAGALIVGTLALTILAFAQQLAFERASVRTQSEVAARNYEARFQVLAQHSSDILTILDADGFVQFVSPAVMTVVGIAAVAVTVGVGTATKVTTAPGTTIIAATVATRAIATPAGTAITGIIIIPDRRRGTVIDRTMAMRRAIMRPAITLPAITLLKAGAAGSTTWVS